MRFRLLLMLLLGLVLAAPVNAQDDTRTVTNATVTFEVPADFDVLDMDDYVIVSSLDTDAALSTPGETTAYVLLDDFFDDAYTDDTLDALLAQASGGELVGIDGFTGDEIVRKRFGDHNVLMMIYREREADAYEHLFAIDGTPVMVAGFFASGEGDQFVDVYKTIISSMRLTDVADVPETSTGITMGADGEAQRWFNSLPGSDAFDELGGISDVAAGPDGRVWVSDGLNIAPVAVATGEVGSLIAPQDFFLFNLLAIDDDDTFLVYSYSEGIARFDSNGRTLATTGLEVFGDNFPYDLSVGPKGQVFVFVSHVDDDYNAEGFMYVFSSQLELVQRTPIASEFFEFGVALFPLDDGNIMLVGVFADFRSITIAPDGTLIDDAPIRQPDTFRFMLGDDAELGPDGNAYYLANGILYQVAPNGDILATFGAESDYRTDTPFVPAELPIYGQMAVVGPGRVVVVGTNFDYSMITLIDFGAE